MHRSDLKISDVTYDGYLVYSKSHAKCIIYQMSKPHIEDKQEAMFAGEEYINDNYPECSFEGLAFGNQKILLFDRNRHEKIFQNGWNFELVNIV